MIAQSDPDPKERDVLCIQQALSGDESGFSELVDRYGGSIHAVALRMLGNRDDAEEAVQEIFMKAYRSLERFRIGERFHPWLYTIAVNHLRSVGRKRTARRGRTAGPYDDGIAVDRPIARYDLPDEVMMRKEAEQAVQAALGLLKPKYREAFVLFEISGLSVSETAAVLELPENTVKTRVRRARLKLADILTREGWP